MQGNRTNKSEFQSEIFNIQIVEICVYAEFIGPSKLLLFLLTKMNASLFGIYF